MKRVGSLALLLLALWGCKDEIVQPPVSLRDNDSASTFTVALVNLRPLRGEERFGFWVQNDSRWFRVSTLRAGSAAPEDTTFLYGWLGLRLKFDSIQRVAVTLDRDTLTMGLPLCEGELEQSGGQNWKASLQVSSGLRGLSGAVGSVTFLSTNGDTTAASKEFYLLSRSNDSVRPSLVSLPNAPSGWEYGVWATDSNFFPQHLFYYGSFVRATGHDSDSLQDAFSFPGGTHGAPINSPGTSILVTLEPTAVHERLRGLGPSVFTILAARLNRFIFNGAELPMKNVSATTLPQGEARFRRFQ